MLTFSKDVEGNMNVDLNGQPLVSVQVTRCFHTAGLPSLYHTFLFLAEPLLCCLETYVSCSGTMGKGMGLCGYLPDRVVEFVLGRDWHENPRL